MKKIHIIFLIFFSFVFYFCAESNITENNLEKGLNFYFLKDTTLTANQITNTSISDLKLADKPFLTYKDLGYYNWSEHSFSIDSNKAYSIGCICEKNITVFGIPFIVAVDQERIYLGAFWFLHSSLAPSFPYIYAIFDYKKNPEILTINKSWDITNSDLRSDPRIYNTLKEYGLLLE